MGSDYKSWFFNHQLDLRPCACSDATLPLCGKRCSCKQQSPLDQPFISVTEFPTEAPRFGNDLCLSDQNIHPSLLKSFPTCPFPSYECTFGDGGENVQGRLLFPERKFCTNNLPHCSLQLNAIPSLEHEDLTFEHSVWNQDANNPNVHENNVLLETSKCTDQFEMEESTMRNDSADIDALLNPSEDESEDEEVVSTGHTPFIPPSGKHGSDSLDVCQNSSKRCRLKYGFKQQEHLVDTANSVQSLAPFCNQDEVISGDPCRKFAGKCISFPHPDCNKIMETVAALRKIVPVGKSKDDPEFFEEALVYLKFMLDTAKFRRLPGF